MTGYTFLVLLNDQGVYGILDQGFTEYYVEGFLFRKQLEPDEYEIISEIDFA